MTLIRSCVEVLLTNQLYTHNHLARLSRHYAKLGFRPPGAPLALPGANALQFSCHSASALRNKPSRQAPCISSDPCHCFGYLSSVGSYCLAVQSTPPNATPVMQNYWFMHLQNTGLNKPTRDINSRIHTYIYIYRLTIPPFKYITNISLIRNYDHDNTSKINLIL